MSAFRSTSGAGRVAAILVLALSGHLAVSGASNAAASGPSVPAGPVPALMLSAASTTPAADASPTPDATTTPDTTPTPGATGTAVYSASVIGRSVRGRPIRAYRIGTGDRRLLVVGGVHGNEWGDDVAWALVKALRQRPGLVPRGLEIHVVPVLNPDGVSRRTRGNARRVDLNRNMPTASWRRRLDRRDPSARAGLTGGVRPGSEPETAALLRYVRGRRFAGFVALHSRGGVLLSDGAGASTIARRISRASGLPLGRLGYERVITGSMGQFFAREQRVPVVTVELASPRLTSGLRDGIVRCLR